MANDLRDLSNKNVVVMVFAMEGCGHCEEFLPRFWPKAEKYLAMGMPVFCYNLASEDPSIQAIATRYEIDSAPTTIVLKRGTGALKLSGGYNDETIDRVLGRAYHTHLTGK